MRARLFIPGLALCTGILLAQSDQQNMPAQTAPSSTAQTMSTTTAGGNSWTGLLVASGCDNTANATSTANTSGSTATGSAMTGPALNGSSGSGMNGTSTNVTGGSATGVSQNTTVDSGRTATAAP